MRNLDHFPEIPINWIPVNLLYLCTKNYLQMVETNYDMMLVLYMYIMHYIIWYNTIVQCVMYVLYIIV